ncbi:D12 class N6 adenine-specific DNA methyltransferase [Secundilactobacillus pentosiphilus]|uniref:D12 class N6 adenine-specific DNA methyltransferase n=1 Tax=Secundilactobacillus pentosiphilus TaxID=1714682 RepID=A0A1Z5IZ83_9LACO|nr:DNA adenine methylase [Secundilactobacillus pentosiphilus]GAX06969.1 D12 class N6 adenine-specific DNA methyltransferase [Secundilactobacillus pentosiphilus]
MKRILNYPGSKWNMARYIISLMPPHTTYLEPFFGSGAVFFNKEPSKIETINDIDGRIVNFFKQCRNHPVELSQLIQLTPLSREEYQLSYEISDDPLEDVRRMMVRSWQAIGGKTSDHTGWRANIDLNGSKTTEWNHIDERILAVASRLKDAQIEHQDAFKLLERYNRPDVLTYVDPPYLMSTRSKRHYAYEFSDADHESLLKQLVDFKGKVILSGYASDMYEEYLSDWNHEMRIASVETGSKRTEVLWCNFIAETSTKQMELLRM